MHYTTRHALHGKMYRGFTLQLLICCLECIRSNGCFPSFDEGSRPTCSNSKRIKPGYTFGRQMESTECLRHMWTEGPVMDMERYVEQTILKIVINYIT